MELFISILIFAAIAWWLYSSYGNSDSGAEMRALELRFGNDVCLPCGKSRPHSEEICGDCGAPKDLTFRQLEVKGLFPLVRSTRVGFVTSVVAKSKAPSDGWDPVLSAVSSFQEPDNTTYRHSMELGLIPLDQGFPDWVQIGLVGLGLLQPPFGGFQKLSAVVRMVDLDRPPDIRHGFQQADVPASLWTESLPFTYSFSEKGYQESVLHRDEARAIAVRMSVAVAMADGSLDETEGRSLQEWIHRTIEPFSQERQAELKALYNTAMKEAYAEAKAGELSLSALTSRLNEIGEKATKYEALELCFDVMAADGVANSEEMATIRNLAEALSLDLQEIEKMRDQKIIGLDTSVSNDASIEELLGIEAGWSKDQIRQHLRAEFQKWNGRLNTLSEGAERDNAQRMLDRVAEARKQYD